MHTTSYGYDAASNLASRTHDTTASASYGYNPRNLLTSETDKSSSTDPGQATTFSYGPRGLRSSETKPNGNKVTYAYFADGLLQHQLETTAAPALATVAEHTYTYNPDAAKASDAQKLMNADTGAVLAHTLTYTYDPRDRVTAVLTDGAQTEAYTHDATGNVTAQTINTAQTTFGYDRDRLLSAAGAGAASYNYDPLGRLDTVTTTIVAERNTYDGFDNITTHQQLNPAGGMDTTGYTYDPLNRQTSKQVNGGTPTQFSYLGLSPELISETGGATPKAYTYTPAGERLSQTTATGPNAGTGYCPTPQQTQQVTQAAAQYGAGCPPTEPGCPGYTPPPPSPANDTGPGGGYCTQIEFKLGACASERGAAGTTPEQVKQSLIGAGMVLLGALPIDDAIGGLFGLLRGATTVADDAGSVAGRIAASCGGASFTPRTKVLLASGAAVPIASLKPGEKVLATNVRTGKSRAEPVTRVLVHHDTNRYNLTVKTAHGTAVIHTTRNHLFWDLTGGRWVKAGALKYGDHLRTPDGHKTVTPIGGWAPRGHDGWMWDLTITGDHDFYIQTANGAVLVHNCSGLGGSISPAAKGAAGVDQTAIDIEQAGGRIIGREVGIKAAGWRVRADLYAELPNGQRAFIEVKTGETAVLNYGQSQAYPEIVARGGVPYGQNAANAGLIPGTPSGRHRCGSFISRGL